MVKNPRAKAGVPAKAPPAAADEVLYLAEWLEALDVRAAKIAIATGINEGYISQLVNKVKKNPSIPKLRLIAAELGLDNWRQLFEPPPNQTVIDHIRKHSPAVIERLAQRRRG